MTTAPDRPGWRQWLGLTVLTLPLLMAATDMTVLFMALPSIAADLAPGSTQMLWILHVGDFLAVGLALTMGRLATRVGARRLLLTGTAVYGLASVAAAYAPTPEVLIAMRALLGVAAATLMPSVMVMVRALFPGPRRFSVAVAVIMSAFSAGMAIGPPMAGFLLEYFWWGAAFLANVPAAAVLLLSAPLLPSQRGEAGGRVDLRSAALSMAAIVMVVFGLQEIADAQSSGSGAALWPYGLSVAAGAALGTVFVRRQLRVADPLLDLRLFASPAFSVSLGAMLLLLLAYGGSDMLFTQFLQTVLGLSPGEAGLLMIAPAAASIAGGLAAPALVRRVRPAFVMAGGLLLAAAGAAATALLAGQAGPLALVGLVTLIALALGPLFPLSTNLAVGTAPPRQAGSAAAMGDVAGGFGQASSLAVLGTISAVVYRSSLSGSAPDGVPEGALAAAGESIGGAVAAAGDLGGNTGRALLEASEGAFTTSVQAGYGFGAVVLAATALLVAWTLRRVRLDGGAGEAADAAEEETETAEEGPETGEALVAAENSRTA
ncbi:MFS transporter [Nocardiopsis suaedae]|uniref:MFS transporter n=1 Tax=Nocardiopsis suaedae TaxID=3018444 RepID=A0ABT4TFG6_9ACTN|nr:MFS transporter [Nocardiopsis suaedae]MDA2803417.1 MFS transporter [Nocardiopsis suaedae]